jgi:hypothetical protein
MEDFENNRIGESDFEIEILSQMCTFHDESLLAGASAVVFRGVGDENL